MHERNVAVCPNPKRSVKEVRVELLHNWKMAGKLFNRIRGGAGLNAALGLFWLAATRSRPSRMDQDTSADVTALRVRGIRS